MYDEWGKPKTEHSKPNIVCVPLAVSRVTEPLPLAVSRVTEPLPLAVREVLLVQQVIKAVANGRELGTMLSATYVAGDTSWWDD